MSWSEKCILSEISITARVVAEPDANPSVLDMVAIQTTGSTFEMNNAKLFVPFVTLNINDNIKF